MGMDAAPQRQKSRRRQWRERPDEPAESLRRSWHYVNNAHAVFGLALASLAPIVPLMVLALCTAEALDTSTMTGFLYFAGIGMFWFVAAGSLFLFWHGHRNTIVERFDCLSLCATLGFLVPMLTAFTVAVLTQSLAFPSGGAVLAFAFCGLCLAPFGAFGGWLLWRTAIRPAARPLREIAEVF
jgi:hypothetical protein